MKSPILFHGMRHHGLVRKLHKTGSYCSASAWVKARFSSLLLCPCNSARICAAWTIVPTLCVMYIFLLHGKSLAYYNIKLIPFHSFLAIKYLSVSRSSTKRGMSAYA